MNMKANKEGKGYFVFVRLCRLMKSVSLQGNAPVPGTFVTAHFLLESGASEI